MWGEIMKPSILSNQEKTMNFIMFLVNIAVPVSAFCFVMLFLQGTFIDAIVLLMAVAAGLIKVFENKLGKYAKYLYTCSMPFWGTFVIIIANDGKFGAMTHAYFLWLILSIPYYDTSVIKACSATTLGMSIVGMILFPASYLKMHNLVVWIFIGIVFVIETLTCVIQRYYYKLTKKRFFPMTPIHHTFEKIGYSEREIVKIFWIIGLIGGMIGIIYGVWL